jgi:uncharacterized protein (TIGR03435 family)
VSKKAFVCVPVLAALCLFAPGAARAQAMPRFEAASVKPADPSGSGFPQMSGGPGTGDPTRIRYSQVPMLLLLTRAYGLDADRVSGPDWLETERYSVEARVPPGASSEAFRQMLQSLLQERFQLTVHREQSQRPGYALVVAKGGHKMKPAPADVPSPAVAALPVPSAIAKDRDGFPVLPPGASYATLPSKGMMRITARMTMAEFVGALGRMVPDSASRPVVVDQTGLAGRFEFRLEYARQLQLSPEVLAKIAALSNLQMDGGASSVSSAPSEGPTDLRPSFSPKSLA